jgi:hypothetical protein
MKNLLIGAALLISVSVFAQDVPSAVTKAFKAKFPTAQEVQWNEGDEGYEADFYMANENKIVKFDEKGTWLETQTTIEDGKFPAAITKSVKAKYSGAELESVQMVESAKATFYNVNASSNTASYAIKLDQAGKILEVEEFANDTDDSNYDEDEE